MGEDTDVSIIFSIFLVLTLSVGFRLFSCIIRNHLTLRYSVSSRGISTSSKAYLRFTTLHLNPVPEPLGITDDNTCPTYDVERGESKIVWV